MSKEELARAKNAVFLLLNVRNRTEWEIRQRLQKKKYSPEVVDAAVAYFYGLQLIDDRAFARSWIQFRLSRLYGLRRIFFELVEKGIDRKVVDEELGRVRPELDEESAIRGLIQKRMSRYKELEPAKAKRRLFQFLANKGFSPEVITKVLNNANRQYDS